MVGQIKEASESINTAAQEIAAGNADPSENRRTQASSLEGPASSMEQLNPRAPESSTTRVPGIGAGELEQRGGGAGRG